MQHSRSRSLLWAWLASLLVFAAPCARNAPTEPTSAGPEPVAERAVRDPELEAVRARLAPFAHDLGSEGVAALARAIVEASRAHSLPPTLLMAVMEVESRFDPYAVSQKGALGLMQILPSTGVEVARRVGIPWRGPRTLFDPRANVSLGAAYLRELLDRYASLRVALAAYNEGPGQIEARLRGGAAFPAHYSERVLGAYWERSAPPPAGS
jgi:soluble lytic murein transglycosylase-like protein